MHHYECGLSSQWDLLFFTKPRILGKVGKTVEKIRVLVANRPRLMREMVVATLADQADIEIVGETADESEITEYVDRTRPDFLIIALEHPEVRPGLCGFLLGRYPQMKILAVAPEQNTGCFFWAIV